MKSCVFFLALPLSLMQASAQLAPENTQNPAPLSEQERVAFDRFARAWVKLRDSYVENPDLEKVIDGGIRGMLSSLDPHSAYMPQKDFDEFIEGAQGHYNGVGIQITVDVEGPTEGMVRVVAPLDDSPASAAGIEAGDVIVAVNKKPVRGMSLNAVAKLLKGKKKDAVDLSIWRKGEPVFDVTLIRDDIKLKSVVHRREGDIGVVRITSFTQTTFDGFREALKALEEQKPVSGLVLDLRNNPGGLLDQAVYVSRMLLDGGEIVSTRSRDPKETERIFDNDGDMLTGRPVVVLINRGSASASEIVAGALQDKGRALIIGERSFGKGSVQTILPLGRDASFAYGKGYGALRLTTARYYTPSGRSIQATGIVPDVRYHILIDGKEPEGPNVREANLENVLANEFSAACNDEDPDCSLKNEPPVTNLSCAAEEDCVLEEALTLLRDPALLKEKMANAHKKNTYAGAEVPESAPLEKP